MVSAAVTGLTPNTTYHFRVVATNSDGATVTGADMTFNTATPPVVITGAASSITANGATLTGSVNPEGLTTTYAFQFGDSTAYGQQSATVTLPAGLSAVAVNAVLHGLHTGHTYHYRLVANNAAGTADGADMTFRTAQLPRTSVLGVSQRACVSSTVLARVTIINVGGPQRIVVTVDGRQVLHTTRARFTVRVPVGHLSGGRHRLRISGVAPGGAPFSQTVNFTRCGSPRVQVRPPFTG